MPVAAGRQGVLNAIAMTEMPGHGGRPSQRPCAPRQSLSDDQLIRSFISESFGLDLGRYDPMRRPVHVEGVVCGACRNGPHDTVVLQYGPISACLIAGLAASSQHRLCIICRIQSVSSTSSIGSS